MLDTENQLSFFDIKRNSNSYRKICSDLSSETDLSPDEFGYVIRKWGKGNIKQPINVVALFSGAGGLDIGFCDCGFTLIESVELEEKFVETMLYNQNGGNYFNKANILCQDIKQYEPVIDDKIDFIIGGPPCQSFSAAGRRAAGVAGTKDGRGSLFEEYVRVLKKLQPKGFLFENVYGLLGAEKGESIKKIVRAFNDIGYRISYRILDAADYGVPQHRERLIIVGLKDKVFKFPKPTHGPDSINGYPHLSAREALLKIDQQRALNVASINGRYGHLLEDVPPGLNYSFFTEKMGHPNPIFAWRSKFSDFLYKADPETPVRTIKASGGQYTGPFHWESRHFTIEELKRLQTFPDNYTILGNRATAIKQIGNSVPPQFARMLALSVLDQVFDVPLPFEFQYLEESEKLSFRNIKRERTKQYIMKAATALGTHTKFHRIEPVKKEYRAKLGQIFQIDYSSPTDVKIKFSPERDKWTFEMEKAGQVDKMYEIVITRQKKVPLFHSVNEIHLISFSDTLTDYTLVWKIFEIALVENGVKADLVQLNGYYQYANDISYNFTSHGVTKSSKIWKLIELVLRDPTIAKIRHISEWEVRYGISREEIIEGFHTLRKIGFEIRNSNTNEEMPEDSYLVPYKFPTLTPLSVQLKKSL